MTSGIRFFLIAASLPAALGCSTVTKQLGAAKNFSQCEFRLKSIDDVFLGGTPVRDLASFSKLTGILSQDELPLTMTLRYEVRNPNPVSAIMNRVEWIMMIEDVEIMHGVIPQKVELPPGPISIAELPVYVQSDLKKIFTRQMASTLFQIASTLSGLSDKSVTIVTRVRPTIEIGGVSHELVDFVDTRFELTAEKARELRRGSKSDSASEPVTVPSTVPSTVPDLPRSVGSG